MALIINADDFGLTPAVNQAILDVFEAGNLTSATLMVNMPGSEDAAARAKAHPDLGVGLHFCITEGGSRTGPSTLTDAAGRFVSRGEITKRAMMGRLDPDDVRKEFVAQLETMADYGIEPTHTDSHQHIMMLPSIFEAIVSVLEKRNLKVRVVRPQGIPVNLLLQRPVKYLKQRLNRRYANRIRASYPGMTNDYLVSIHEQEHHLRPDRATYRKMVVGFDPRDLVEVMVHPYILDRQVRALYPSPAKETFLHKCAREYEVLSGEPIFDDNPLINYAQF